MKKINQNPKIDNSSLTIDDSQSTNYYYLRAIIIHSF
ncbi:hypothetical protein SAMN05216324_10395 [Chryseobacterium limigenitum]|uniref:Uncharacterized protein n=1 Tax=Chryseobacterium limigenitum TaxID=1612149 RepID=A0A1K2IIG0_9FLAO|nr:hypothetical protein SAMN05216324_10395 [Chryseobacterium limigenitum]